MNQDFLDCPCENNCLEGCENCSNSVCECKDRRFNNFCKSEKAHIGAISWMDIGSVWPPLLTFKKLARWHPVQKSYSRFHIHGNIATYTV